MDFSNLILENLKTKFSKNEIYVSSGDLFLLTDEFQF